MHVEAEIEEAVVLPGWYTGGGAMAIAALLVLVHLVTKGGKGTGSGGAQASAGKAAGKAGGKAGAAPAANTRSKKKSPKQD